MSSHLPSANTLPQSQNDRLLASSPVHLLGSTSAALDANADLPLPGSPRRGSIDSLTPHLAASLSWATLSWATLSWATLTNPEFPDVAAVL